MGSSLRSEWEWGNGHFRHVGSWAQQWLWDSINEVWPDHRLHNHFEMKKMSISWLLQANPPTQDESQNIMCRAWLPVPNHHSCLFLHSHMSLSSVGLFPSVEYWPKIFMLACFTQQDTKGVCLFWEQGQGLLRVLQKSHHAMLLRLYSYKQISPFHVLNPSEVWGSLLNSGGQFAQIQSEPFLVYVYLTL